MGVFKSYGSLYFNYVMLATGTLTLKWKQLALEVLNEYKDYKQKSIFVNILN